MLIIAHTSAPLQKPLPGQKLPQKSQIMAWKADIVLAVMMIFSTAVIALYDPSPMNDLQELEYVFRETFFQDPSNNVFETPWYLQSIIDPSLAVFCLAVLLYGFASSAFYRSHARDQYQVHILAVSAISGVLISIFCRVNSTELRNTWQATLPSAFTLGLILSAMGHGIWRLMPREEPMIIDYNYDWEEKIHVGQKLPY